jgi:glycosyltransferase involved in cell wall biosynthesis
MNRLLMVAYHFPPLAGSSGIQRALRFAQHLPALGWQPTVLTVTPNAYTQTSDDLLSELPSNLHVARAWAFDTSRHLSLLGKYPGWLARPDRWISWMAAAIPAGLGIIKRERPAAIWSTYPIPTAHLIANALSQISGLPWVADFRDPMAHLGYPQDPDLWQSYLRTEQKVFRQARCMIFATPGAANLYRARYPNCASNIHLIENGYDEEAFLTAEQQARAGPLNPGTLTLLHSGIVYPEWRNPTALFTALQQLLAGGMLARKDLRLRFRAPVHDAWLAKLAQSHGLEDMVEILPAVSYTAALSEMLAADALLVLQSHDCNDQVPAKVYEYLRAGKPILGLTDPQGDTAAVLRSAGMGPVCALESAPDIAKALANLTVNLTHNALPTVNTDLVHCASRAARTASLAALLDNIVAKPSQSPSPYTLTSNANQ